MKVTAICKTAVRNDGMQMGIEVEKISIGLNRNTGAGNSIIIGYTGFKIFFDDVPGADKQLCQ